MGVYGFGFRVSVVGFKFLARSRPSVFVRSSCMRASINMEQRPLNRRNLKFGPKSTMGALAKNPKP